MRHFLGNFMLNSNLKRDFKNLNNLSMFSQITVQKSVFFFNFFRILVSFLALTHSIFIFDKALSRFEFSIKYPRKLFITFNFLKYFFLEPYGDFSDFKSSIRNCVAIQKRKCYYNTLLRENAANSGDRLADFQKKSHISISP